MRRTSHTRTSRSVQRVRRKKNTKKDKYVRQRGVRQRVDDVTFYTYETVYSS